MNQDDMGGLSGSREPDPSCTGSGPPGFDPGRTEALLRSLLDGEFTSLTIGFNDLHACNYTTAKGWSEEMGAADGGMQTYNDPRDWVSPEEREKALENNSVWSIQWYPNTPVGFCQLYASSLEALLEAIAMETRRAETTGSVAKP
jgi:hypothetical protein